MARWLSRFGLVLALVAATSAGSPAAESSSGTPAPSLASVNWDGPAADLSALRGKTVVVLTYVTWCPKCNEWAPQLLSQLSKAAYDKPVAVVAVATDVGPSEGRQFLLGKQFAGPNIFYDADANLEAALGALAVRRSSHRRCIAGQPRASERSSRRPGFRGRAICTLKACGGCVIQDCRTLSACDKT